MIRHAHERIREAFAGERWALGEEELGRLRGDPDALSEAEALRRRGLLRGNQVVDLWGEALEEGLLLPPSRGALGAHLFAAWMRPAHAALSSRLREAMAAPARVESDLWAPARLLERLVAEADGRRRADFARSAEAWVEGLRAQLTEGFEEHQERAAELHRSGRLLDPGAPDPDAGPGPEERPEAARAFLRGTEEAAQELFARALHSAHASEDWAGLLHALRASEADGAFRPGPRFRRLAELFAPLGLRLPLESGARLGPPRGGLSPSPRLILLGPPKSRYLCPSSRELGLISELAAARGLGRLLAHALASPALPIELAIPTRASVARATGSLFEALLADRGALRTHRGLSERESEALARRGAAALLLRARLLAAAVSLEGEDRRGEAAEAAFRSAALVELPASLARSLFFALWLEEGEAGSWGLHAEARAAQLAPALWFGLRERFDRDWYRNPRAGPLLRGAAERGGGLCVESWAEELGVGPEQALARIRELAE